MRHDPIYITMQARQLVERYGDDAVAHAQHQFNESMHMQNINIATMWLSITHEVQAILQMNDQLN